MIVPAAWAPSARLTSYLALQQMLAACALQVRNPEDAHPFLPLLIPALAKVSEEAADPKLREVAGRAHALLVSIKDADDKQQQEHAAHPTDTAACLAALKKAVEAEAASGNPHASAAAAAAGGGRAAEAVLSHVAAVASALVACHVYGTRSWEASTAPYLEQLLGGHAAAAAVGHALQRWAADQCGVADADEEEDAGGDGGTPAVCLAAVGGKQRDHVQ